MKSMLDNLFKLRRCKCLQSCSSYTVDGVADCSSEKDECVVMRQYACIFRSARVACHHFWLDRKDESVDER